MRTLAPFLTAVILLVAAGPAPAQQAPRHLDLEVEPLAYAFGGAGGHVAYQAGSWKYEIEVFRLEIPASLHGNDAFEASPLGLELRAQGKEAYSLKNGLRGWTFAWNTATARFPDAGATVVQVRRTGKGCLSYLIGSEGEAIVVDPALSPEVYETQAEERGWTITGVLDTHIHADHLSRARAVAEATGATLYLPEQERVSFDHAPVSDGDALKVGTATVDVLHTPESTTYRLGTDALFTGDTLFLKGVGRPDLDADAEQGRRKARQLHRSLQRLARHPGDRTVLPGHASEPMPFDDEIVGAPLRAAESEVEALQWTEEQFVGRVTENVPPTPPNHETVIAANTTGDWPTGDVVDLEAGGNRCAVG